MKAATTTTTSTYSTKRCRNSTKKRLDQKMMPLRNRRPYLLVFAHPSIKSVVGMNIHPWYGRKNIY
jgi:hypothetical protein